MGAGSSVPKKFVPYLNGSDLEAISRAVDDVEKRTAGEIRVHIVFNLLPLEKPRARAIRDFYRLGIDRTREATGILLFLVLKKRRFEIVADRGIHTRVPGGTWERIARETEAEIKELGLARGICHGIQKLGEVLELYVPNQPGDQDELADRPSLEE